MSANFVGEALVSVTNPLNLLWYKFVNVLPGIIFAIIILIIGAFVGIILGHALRVILDKTKLDTWLRRLKLTKAVGHTDVPALLGELLKWWIIIIFLQQAVELLNLGTFTTLLGDFTMWLPKLLVAIVVFLLGLAAAHFVEIKIQEHTKLKGMRAVGVILKWIIVILVLLQAVDLIVDDISFLQNIVLYIVVALAAGLALALGIGLGLGLRKQSESFLKELKKSL